MVPPEFLENYNTFYRLLYEQALLHREVMYGIASTGLLGLAAKSSWDQFENWKRKKLNMLYEQEARRAEEELYNDLMKRAGQLQNGIFNDFS